jgi:hypothetical protein
MMSSMVSYAEFCQPLKGDNMIAGHSQGPSEAKADEFPESLKRGRVLRITLTLQWAKCHRAALRRSAAKFWPLSMSPRKPRAEVVQGHQPVSATAQRPGASARFGYRPAAEDCSRMGGLLHQGGVPSPRR